MSDVSFFQRYSQKENHVTNNVLLFLKYIYQDSPKKFGELLEVITESTDIDLGVSFSQQIKGSHSVPDGLIIQNPFQIYIETKLGNDLDEAQLSAHLKSIKNAKPDFTGKSFLLGLTKLKIDDDIFKRMHVLAKENDIIFANTTFSELALATRNLVKEYEINLTEIIEDFENYLTNQNLTPIDENKMLAVLCSQTLEDNVKHNFYFEPPERPSKWHAKYLGLYANKKVSYIGEIRCVFISSVIEGNLHIEPEYGGATETDKKVIENFINDEKSPYYPELKDGETRFYFVNNFEPTNFSKTSKGGMMGHCYFYLDNFEISYKDDLKVIAEKLSSKTFT